jgi:hypothetical protein
MFSLLLGFLLTLLNLLTDFTVSWEPILGGYRGPAVF